MQKTIRVFLVKFKRDFKSLVLVYWLAWFAHYLEVLGLNPDFFFCTCRFQVCLVSAVRKRKNKVNKLLALLPVACCLFVRLKISLHQVSH